MAIITCLREADRRFSRSEIIDFLKTIHIEIDDMYFVDPSMQETMGALLYGRTQSFYGVYHNTSAEFVSDIINFNKENKDRFMIFRLDEGEYPPEEVLPKYTELRDFNLYFQRNDIDAKLYTSKELKTGFVVTHRQPLPKRIKISHYIQSAIPRVLPWIFEEHPLTDVEKELLNTAEKSYEDYIRCIDILFSEKNLREMVIKKTLDKFQKYTKDREVELAEESLESCQYDRSRLEEKYAELLVKIQELQRKVFALKYEAEQAEEDSSLADLFIKNKNLELLGHESGSLLFSVVTPLMNYNPEMFDKNNTRFFAGSYSCDDPFWTQERRMKFLGELFSAEPEICVRMFAKIRVETGGDVRAYSDADDAERHDCVQNSHLARYNCFGGNHMVIQKCLVDGDWYMAIQQCIAATGSQNLLETATAPMFFEDIFESRRKIIELPDGSNVTTIEAYKWLLDNNKIKEEE